MFAYVVSFPKCGRTWLRTMVTAAVAYEYGVEFNFADELPEILRRSGRRKPKIRFTHADTELPRAEADETPPSLAERPVVFLVRDPRDVVVSFFHQRTKREGDRMEISEFVRDPDWGIARAIEFMNRWWAYRARVAEFSMIRYEDMHIDPEPAIRTVLRSAGTEVSDDAVSFGIERGRFEVMKADAAALAGTPDLYKRQRYAPLSDDPHGDKIRRGKVGGYVDELSPEDRLFVDSQVLSLHPDFGYGVTVLS